MFTNNEKNACIEVKYTFEKSYRFSSASIASLMDRMVFAGGVFSSLFLGENPRDVDVFILNTDTLADQGSLTNFISANGWKINSKISKDAGKYPDANSHISSVWKVSPLKTPTIDYDIIFTDYSTPEVLVKDFDYEHSKVWYHNGKLNLTPRTFKAIKDMKLILCDGKTHTEERKQKFIDRGWKL
jgi:hypothetical protein